MNVTSELPNGEMLVLTVKAVEGDVLAAVEVIPMNEIQQHVWEKYKKEGRYQLFSVTSHIIHSTLFFTCFA